MLFGTDGPGPLTHDRLTRPLPGINFYCPISVVSGLGSASRGWLAALRAAGLAVSTVPAHEVFFHQKSVGNSEPRARPRHPVSLVQINADAVPRFLHFHARTFASSKYKIGVWSWELPAFRDEWWSELRHFDEIWVPSHFCRRAVQAMTAKPVVVIPSVVSPSASPQPGWRDRLKVASDEFVFLFIFDASSLTERKNPRALMRAFPDAFPGDERVRLVLKISNADSDPGLSRCLDALAARDRRIVVLRQTMEPDELAGLVTTADCYVSPHRSEGFGLTVAEAMASGLPVIATDYSGTVDFLSSEVGFPLRYRLVELDRDHGPYMRGAIWAEPSVAHLQELLRFVMAHPDEAALRGQRARERILRDYSAAAVGRRMIERLTAIVAGRDWGPAGERA
jgi:glycosyltransferase involved in cell wall biosynthesis